MYSESRPFDDGVRMLPCPTFEDYCGTCVRHVGWRSGGVEQREKGCKSKSMWLVVAIGRTAGPPELTVSFARPLLGFSPSQSMQ